MGRRRGKRSGGSGAWLVLIVAVVAWFGACSVCVRCAGEGGKDLVIREQRADQERAVREQRAVEEQQRARAVAQQESQAADAKRFADRRTAFAAMNASGREKALREACAVGPACRAEDADLLVAAAATDAERAKLTNLRSALQAMLDPKQRHPLAAVQATERPAEQPPRQAPVRAQESAGRVCCCDGSVSPTCSTAHRGCCSHHGGVCACN